MLNISGHCLLRLFYDAINIKPEFRIIIIIENNTELNKNGCIRDLPQVRYKKEAKNQTKLKDYYIYCTEFIMLPINKITKIF